MKRVTEICIRLIRIFLTGLLLGLPVEVYAESSTNDEFSEHKIQSMTLADKVGQLMMVGFYGTRFEDGLQSALNRYRPGFAIVFSRNIKSGLQIANLNYAAQMKARALNGIPLFIAIDQEGGVVTRIKTRKPLPSAWSIGATGNPLLAQRAGEGTGRLLKELGFSMDLAPVLDVAAAKHESFLGTRAFSQNSLLVSRMAGAFAKGLREQGILPTAKHFPGHGKVATDSHVHLPVKQLTLAELLADDLIPYKTWVNDNNDAAIMMAHLALPKVDASGTPATFSKVIVTELLRQKLGYGGLVVSDDLDMAGATSAGRVGERAIRAVEAGVDVLMLAWNRRSQAEVFQAMMDAVRSGRISEARLNQSVRRILRAKTSFKADSLSRPTITRIDSALKNPELAQLSDQVSRANFERQIEHLDKSALNVGPNSPIVVISFRTQFAKNFASAHLFKKIFFGNPNTVSLDKLQRFVLHAQDRLIIATLDGPGSARFLNSLPIDLKRRTLILNHNSPEAVENSEDFGGILELGTFHPASGEWIAKALSPAGERGLELRTPADDDTP